GAGVHRVEQVAAAHGDHFLGRGESAVVAEDAADEAGAEQVVGALEQLDPCALPGGGDRGGAAGPASADYYHFHGLSPLLTGMRWDRRCAKSSSLPSATSTPGGCRSSGVR